MRITYDKKADALNITLKKSKVVKTVEISPEVFVDFDGNNNPLYVEIIGASEKVGEENFREISVGSKSIKVPSSIE